MIVGYSFTEIHNMSEQTKRNIWPRAMEKVDELMENLEQLPINETVLEHVRYNIEHFIFNHVETFSP